MGLSNYQLVLLDNLIYLDTVVTNGGNTIREVVNTLLYKDGIPGENKEIGTLDFVEGLFRQSGRLSYAWHPIHSGNVCTQLQA
ncbi:MAG: hypothetical protein NC489_36600 [Ruminococcus flavefaciens]|nr:hypothetical protein [Ruminococcus flavefaciens]